MLPNRKTLPHENPLWIKDNSTYFLTVCCRPRGTNQLCRDSIAIRLWESVLHRQELGQWQSQLFLLMPDHLHMLVNFSTEVDVPKTISAWKRYGAAKMGIRWQQGFFEHRIRNIEMLIQKREYIQLNPVRAGLVESPTDWKYCWNQSSEI